MLLFSYLRINTFYIRSCLPGPYMTLDGTHRPCPDAMLLFVQHFIKELKINLSEIFHKLSWILVVTVFVMLKFLTDMKLPLFYTFAYQTLRLHILYSLQNMKKRYIEIYRPPLSQSNRTYFSR